VDADGEGFGERRQPGRQDGRHLDAGDVVEHHGFGVAAGVPARVADGVQALGVERHGHRHDDVTDLQVVAARRRLHDLTAELVAHHGGGRGLQRDQLERLGRGGLGQLRRQPQLLGAVPQHVQIAAADPARQHLGQHLARTWHRVGHLLHRELPVAHHGGSHGVRT